MKHHERKPSRAVSDGAVHAALERFREAQEANDDPLWCMRLALETAAQIDASESTLGIPPIAIDDEPTAVEQLIAADAERWHYECERRGSLFAQSIGKTVLDALVRGRVAALRVMIFDIQQRLSEMDDKVDRLVKRAGA